MLSAFFTGFFLGLSLIVAIGAQNSFVLRQGILGQHVFYIALFCALADALLISIGVAGMSFFLNNIINQISNFLFGFSALWLTGYGVLRLKAVFKADIMVDIDHPVLGDVRLVGLPVHMSDAPLRIRYTPPQLGQHTDEIIDEFGLSRK